MKYEFIDERGDVVKKGGRFELVDLLNRTRKKKEVDGYKMRPVGEAGTKLEVRL